MAENHFSHNSIHSALYDEPAGLHEHWTCGVVKAFILLGHTPLALVAGVAGGWVYLAWALLVGEVDRRKMLGGWMLAIALSVGFYVLFRETTTLSDKASLIWGIALGATGKTGFMLMQDRALEMFGKQGK